MARYLVQVAYTPEAWANLLKNPQNRLDNAADVAESLGGTFESAYLAFGEYDVVLMLDLPDNTTAAAVSMVYSAGGAIKSIKTTPLIGVPEGIEAMRKASVAVASYRPPGMG
jgi:uncharacterized protein with GYD domain